MEPTNHVDPATPTAGTENVDVNLDLIERELADVGTALQRLDSGDYWTDEVTGEPLRPDVLAQHPTARRNPD